MSALKQGHPDLIVWVVVFLMVAGVAAASDEAESVGKGELLQRQVRYLSEALASARAEVDLLKARVDSLAYEVAGGTGGMPAESATVVKKEYLILDVNKELGMVILNGGRQDGVKPGLQFAVLQGDKAVAMVRVVDARTAIAGAVIYKMGRELPRVQDRAIVANGSRN